MVSTDKKHMTPETSAHFTYPARPSSAIDFSGSGVSKKIKSGEYKIAIYGLGHVGCPLASVWLRAGAHVIGVDKSPKVLENARMGKTDVPEPGVNEAFTKGIKDKRLTVYDYLIKASQDSILMLVCVPVLL